MRKTKHPLLNNFFVGTQINIMSYFNYHAKIKQLIRGGHLVGYAVIENYHGISPALVLYFDNEKPMPIREHRFDEYFEILGIKK